MRADCRSLVTARQRDDLLRYYPQDLDDIPDVFVYRLGLLAEEPALAERARTALVEVAAGIGKVL